MQVQQIIRASADVLTITTLAPGNVYKRVEEGYQGEAILRFGVVQSVMNNGADAAVTALEYAPDYTKGVTATLKVFTGARPAAIFPATPEEVTAHLADITRAANEAVTAAEKDLAAKRAVLRAVRRVNRTVGALTAPDVTGQDAGAVQESAADYVTRHQG